MKKSTENYLLAAGAGYTLYFVGRNGALGEDVQQAMLQIHKKFMSLFGVTVNVPDKDAAPGPLLEPFNEMAGRTAPGQDYSYGINQVNTGPFNIPFQQSIGVPGFIGTNPMPGGIEGGTGI